MRIVAPTSSSCWDTNFPSSSTFETSWTPIWHGDTQDAYDAFEQKMPPPDMGGTDLKDIPEKRRKRREGSEMMGNFWKSEVIEQLDHIIDIL